MGLIIATATAFAAWITLYSIGAKSFDALMVSIVIILIAATSHIVSKQLPGNKQRSE